MRCEKCGHENTTTAGKGLLSAIWEEVETMLDGQLKKRLIMILARYAPASPEKSTQGQGDNEKL